MKANKFRKYIEYEILQIDKKIITLTNNKETIRAKAEKVVTKQNMKDLKSIYNSKYKRNIFNFFIRPSREKIIDFYIEEKKKEYDKEIEYLISKRQEFNETLESFKDGLFTLPFHPCTETLNLYLKYASENNIDSIEFVNQVLLLIKLNTLLYDNKLERQNQMQSNLSSLYNDFLNIKDKKTLKSAKFIIKKIFYKTTTKNEELNDYLNKVLEEYEAERIDPKNNPYRAIIKEVKKPENIERYRQQFILKEYMKNEKETILTKEIIQSLSESKLKIISEALELAKSINNKNIIIIIKRAIEDIISMEKYNLYCQTPNEVVDNEDITHSKTDTLKTIIKTYKNINEKETTNYYLKDPTSIMPSVLIDINNIDILSYGKIMELLSIINVDTPKVEIQRVRNYPIYKTTYDNIVLYYTIKDNKIYIIKLGSLVYHEKYDTIDFNIYFEEINKKIDHSVQKIYAAIIEKELDITYDRKYTNILLKTKQDI